MSSSFTSSIPATSLNLVLTSVWVLRTQVLVPNGNHQAPHHLPINLNSNNNNPIKNKIGKICSKNSLVIKPVSSYFTSIGTAHVSTNHSSFSDVSAGLLVSQTL